MLVLARQRQSRVRGIASHTRIGADVVPRPNPAYGLKTTLIAPSDFFWNIS